MFFAPQVFAHEAYVLTKNEFQKGLEVASSHPLAPLLNPTHLKISIIITFCVILTYFLSILWATTKMSAKLDKLIKKANLVGPLIIRISISASFFFAAMTSSILGPELSLNTMPYGYIMKFGLFLISIMILFGFLTEFAALIGLSFFIYTSFYFKFYIITYANYFGELIVLFLFGSRFVSFDLLLFGKNLWIEKLNKLKYLEIPIVRILYGVALIYAGWSIKFIHQIISVEVYNQYHLINFFHASASFIAAGAGLSEILIGLFILIGFSQRLTVLISLFFITISILYFREMLWPHFMLYGISFSIFINSTDKFTVDRYLIPFVRLTLKKMFRK